MTRRVMVAPVGFEYDRVIEAQKFEPCNIWYVLRNPAKGADTVGEYSCYFADKVEQTTSTFSLQQREIIDVIQSSVLDLVRAFADIVNTELDRDKTVNFVFNVSSSTKAAGFAASLVAGFCSAPVKLIYLRPRDRITLMSIMEGGSKDFTAIKAQFLEHGDCHAPFEIQYFPVVPQVPLTETQTNILKDLKQTRNRDTLKALAKAVLPHQEITQKDLVKVGWSVKALEKLGLLSTQKVNLTKSVGITPEGEIVVAAIGTHEKIFVK